jgi:hypothetical protein
MEIDIDWNIKSKWKFIKHGSSYYQHKPTDGQILKIEIMGSPLYNEHTVIRHLYKKNDKKHNHIMDIRNFSKLKDENWVYIQINKPNHGIRIKNYNRNQTWVGETTKKIFSIYGSIKGFYMNKEPQDLYRKKYTISDITELREKDEVRFW